MHRCPECGEVAAEPKLRYCENCGARMPEYKPPAIPVGEEVGTHGEPIVKARPKPAYTGPKWLEYVPGHSPSVLGVGLLLVAMGLSILPSLAGLGPFWSFVMLMGSLVVVAREMRATGEGNVLVDWVPESFQPPLVPAVYTALAVAFTLPMLELSIQPLLWLGGTALLVRDQWGKVFAVPGGYAEMFEPRSLVRGPRLLALVGVGLCLLALFFVWTPDYKPPVSYVGPSAGGLRSLDAPLPTTDVLYRGLGYALAGYGLPVGPTVEVGLLALLVLLMLRPEVDRPEWLRFVPAGMVVIALAWALVNMRLKVGPIMFLAGLVPVGVLAFLHIMGRDEPPPPAYAGEEGLDAYGEGDAPEYAPAENEEDMPG